MRNDLFAKLSKADELRNKLVSLEEQARVTDRFLKNNSLHYRNSQIVFTDETSSLIYNDEMLRNEFLKVIKDKIQDEISVIEAQLDNMFKKE